MHKELLGLTMAALFSGWVVADITTAAGELENVRQQTRETASAGKAEKESLILDSSLQRAQAQVSPRIAKTINRDWTSQYFPAETPDAAAADPAYDDSRWPAVALPHTWSTYETTRDLHPFIKNASERDDSYWWCGWGWYRKRFSVDPKYSGRSISLEFDGVQKYCKVYLNGVLIGEHKGGYTSFSLDITPHLRFGQENVLALQVSNRRDDPFGGIPPMTAGNFDVYGGIYRDVRLVIRNRLYVPFQGSADHQGGTFVNTPDVTAERASVSVAASDRRGKRPAER